LTVACVPRLIETENDVEREARAVLTGELTAPCNTFLMGRDTGGSAHPFWATDYTDHSNRFTRIQSVFIVLYFRL